MGLTALERQLWRKRDLEIALGKLEAHPRPKLALEQYTIPAKTAAEILFIASEIYDDIEGKRVVDLGCGSGRLAIGSAMLGAHQVIAIDIDPTAIKVAKKNAEVADVKEKVQWIVSDLNALSGKFDTAIQNPPFGVRRRGADRKFIEKAVETAGVTYSLHRSGERSREFIKRMVEKHSGVVSALFEMELTIPKIFPFHERKKHMIKVDLYRIVSKCQKGKAVNSSSQARSLA